MYYPCSENEGTDQLRSCCEADLRLCFRHADCWFSHAAAQLSTLIKLSNESRYLLVEVSLVPAGEFLCIVKR